MWLHKKKFSHLFWLSQRQIVAHLKKRINNQPYWFSSDMDPLHIHVAAMLLLLYCIIVWIFSSGPAENLPAKSFLTKVQFYIEGIYFMIFSKDSKGLGPKYNPDPKLLTGKPSQTKRFVFIRHGESDWNDVFNKGFGPSIIVRIIKALIREAKLMITMDSVFLDSPLNIEGIEQAKELSRFLVAESEKGNEQCSLIVGKKDSSIVVSSNLRRAISTTTIALWPRVHQTGEKITILSSLQEISRNIDTKALSSLHKIPDLDRISHHCGHDDKFVPEMVYDASENHGNKTTAFYGIKRLKAFNEWAFHRKESAVIVGGHSLWFKHFFQTYLPFDADHPAKKQKIVNSGVVSFVLHRVEDEFGAASYRIDPSSIETIYGGYTSK